MKMVDMLKALSKDKSSVILQDLEPLRSRVAGLLNLGGKSPREILGRVKVIDPSVIHGEPETFLTIGSALFEHKRVQISYYSRTRRRSPFVRSRPSVWFITETTGTSTPSATPRTP